jgi:TP901 family phage tail tape measure protein
MAKEVRKVHINVTSNTGKEMTKGAVAAKGLKSQLQGVGAAATAATGGIRTMTAALLSSGVGAIVVALGSFVAVLGNAFTVGKKFQRGMSELRAVNAENFETTEELNEAMSKMGKTARHLGATTRFTAMEVLSLETALSKAGFTANEVVNSTEGVLFMAQALGSGLAESAEVAGGVIRAYGLDAAEAGRVSDVLALSASKSRLSFDSLREAFAKAGPMAAAAGLSLEESAASLGILVDVIGQGSVAGTAFQQMIIQLNEKGLTMQQAFDKVNNSTDGLSTALELAGKRGGQGLLILAQQSEDTSSKLSKLTEEFENAEGAAKRMAELMEDNLDGDINKMKSSWEGLMLSIEDGDGIMNKIARGGIQAITDGITGINKAFAFTKFFIEDFRAQLRETALGVAATVKGLFDKMFLNIEAFAVKAKLAMAEVPLIGGAIDEEAAKANLKRIEQDLEKANMLIDKGAEYRAIANGRSLTRMARMNADWDEAEAERKQIIEDRENQRKESKAAEETKKAIEKRKEFLSKLQKMEEDADDESNLEKIRRRKERHLKELDELKFNTTEKLEAKKRIEALYAELEAQEKAKIRKRVEDMFGTDDPFDKINRQEEAHLLEMEKLELQETEKQELKKRIEEHYEGLRDQAQLAIDQKKIDSVNRELEQDMRLRDQKSQMLYQTLDTASQVAGEETKIAKALQAIKLAMQLQELAMKMGLIKDELKVKAEAALSEAGIEGAKVGTATAQGMAETSKIGFPWNVITMASYALQAASLIKGFATQKKKLTNIASAAGGSGGGAQAAAPAPPSFNVIGATSAGDEMVAGAIGEVNANPVQAYVVESEISSSQSLARQTEDTASLG